MVSNSDLPGALQFAETAARDRVARYREQATQFRALAETKPVGRLRTQLLRLANEYELMVETQRVAGDAHSAPARSRDAST